RGPPAAARGRRWATGSAAARTGSGQRETGCRVDLPPAPEADRHDRPPRSQMAMAIGSPEGPFAAGPIGGAVMNLRDLQYLVALADHRHFGKAASASFVSQPT